MGAFDFTYEIPNNFDKRVVQFLEQSGIANIEKAFQRCDYEYEDMGLAYYAGLKGDNWDKKALDFTFETLRQGAERCHWTRAQAQPVWIFNSEHILFRYGYYC